MIAIVDYGMGNLHSVSQALTRLDCPWIITSDHDEINRANGLILPGVGAFGDAMNQLQTTGLDQAVINFAQSGKPLLGICLGMQLLFTESEEHGKHNGLNLLPGVVVRLQNKPRVPHMGWNELIMKRLSVLMDETGAGHVYFVHSYHVLPQFEQDVIATVDYEGEVTAIVGRNNVYGMQFHPEKSGKTGIDLLRRFVAQCKGLA